MDHKEYLQLLEQVIHFFELYHSHLLERIPALQNGARAQTALYNAEINEVELVNIQHISDKLVNLYQAAKESHKPPTDAELSKVAAFIARADWALSREQHHTALAAVAIPVPIHKMQSEISTALYEQLKPLMAHPKLKDYWSQNDKTWHRPMHDDGIDFIVLKLIPWLLKSPQEEKQILGRKELSDLLAERKSRAEQKPLKITGVSMRDDLGYFPDSFQPAFSALKSNVKDITADEIKSAIETIELSKERRTDDRILMH